MKIRANGKCQKAFYFGPFSEQKLDKHLSETFAKSNTTGTELSLEWKQWRVGKIVLFLQYGPLQPHENKHTATGEGAILFEMKHAILFDDIRTLDTKSQN